MRASVPLALAAALSVSSYSFTVAREPGPCDTWSKCVDASGDAVRRQEYAAALDLAQRARQLGPARHPLILEAIARAESLAGHPGDALATLITLAAMGVPTDARTSPQFAGVRALDGWPPVEDALARAAAPVEHSDIAFTLPEPDLIAESLVHDAVSDRFLVSSRFKRKIVVFSEQTRRVADLATFATTGFDGVAGMRIDTHRGDLWAVSAAVPQMFGFQPQMGGRSALHKMQLVSGRELASYEAEVDGNPNAFSDLVVLRSGMVLVTDAAANAIYRLRLRASMLTMFVELGQGLAPRGIAIAPDERVAWVAHAEGVSRIDLATRKVTRLAGADDVVLAGIGGLSWWRDSLIAVQGGLPGIERVVRFQLERSGTRVTTQEVLDANLPDYDIPTAGTLVGDDFYYIANSQLDRFQAPGRPGPADRLRPTVVRRLALAGSAPLAH